MTDGKIRVMLVDDSAVIRGLITQALAREPLIQIVASVMNGKAALESLKRIPADVVLMDVEMPEMDGLTALPLMLQASPQTKIIMVSSLTQKNAETTLKAMSLGAADCIGKPESKLDKDARDAFFREVIQKVVALGALPRYSAPAGAAAQAVSAPASVSAPAPVRPNLPFSPPAEIKCLAIGSSTGGPQALMALFRQLLGKGSKVPIFITQHMPATFTTILANHLHTASNLPCEEGRNTQEALPGHIYIAPGDYHLVPRFENRTVRNYLNQDPPVNYCRPAVDPMFQALAGIYGPNLLAVVLTGMGQDGMEGARVIKAKGGSVIAQDEETSVVWGMPGAVTKAGLADSVLPLDEIAKTLVRVLP